MRDRPRRLREHPVLRAICREARLHPHMLVQPFFVREGRGERRAVPAMPGVHQLSRDTLVREARELVTRSVRAAILFGIPRRKDARGSGAYARSGVVQNAIRALKDTAPELLVVADVCLCQYTDHGHCGIVVDGCVDNDRTLPLIARTAVSLVEAGADVVAPSGMMDGAVAAIRTALEHTPILAYAAKYASAFYGPFRQAAESTPMFGDRSTYQMDPANSDEAMREIELDIREGADIVMVKPALAYLDVLRRARETFTVPLAAYNVSGEYSMVKAAAERGWIDERRAVLEILTAIRRAGASWIITYWAREAAAWMS